MAPIQPTQRLNVEMIPGLPPPGSSVAKHAAKGPPSLEVKTACQGELSPLKASSHRNILSGDEECGLEREARATYSLELFPLNWQNSGLKSLALKINNSESWKQHLLPDTCGLFLLSLFGIYWKSAMWPAHGELTEFWTCLPFDCVQLSVLWKVLEE